MCFFVILIETIVLPANIPVLDGGLTENRRYWIPQNDLFWETWVRQTHMSFFCRGCNVFLSSIDVHPPPAHLRNTKKNIKTTCVFDMVKRWMWTQLLSRTPIRSSPSWSSFYGHGSRSVFQNPGQLCPRKYPATHRKKKNTFAISHCRIMCWWERNARFK